ncbi:MAG: FlgD immunoglobulin-like domain containing protein, partial [Candidatus Cloacimonetes bacterium]|nr:FlgD immunoglobulin-like domain containing protein [Candidatus Cloacimonadota bacterium]
TTDYEIGDGISGLTGKLNPYFETLQFLPTVDPGAATSHGNDLEIPVLTISELTADIGINQYQSRMVQINNVSIDDASGNYTTNPAENYTISDATGSMTFRTTFFNVDYIDTPMHTGVITMRGIIAHFQDTVQITPRMLADFNPLANEELVASPSGISLKGNYPNPFNPHTTIEFNMEKAAPAQIEIYNQKGQIIKTIDVANAHKGINTLSWNGTDNSGRGVSSGVYYFRLKSGSYSSTKKMVLMK